MHRIYSFEHYDYVCFHQIYCDKLAKNLETLIGYRENSSIPHLEPRPVSSLEIATLISQLKKRETTCNLFVLDMRKITHSPIHSMETMVELLEINKYKGILFVIDDPNLFSLVEQEYKKILNNIEFKPIGVTCGLLASKDFCLHVPLVDYSDVVRMIDGDVARFIFQALKSQEIHPMEKLYSSNVYINRYFNAKKALVKGEVFHLIVYSMTKMLETVLGELVNQDFDAFVCASITGACFASALSVFFQKPVIYLKNIGPSMSANDERMIERIRKSKRYVYVFDFICLGSEFDRMRMICNIRLAKVVASIGISYYRFPHFETIEKNEKIGYLPFDWTSKSKIAALFQINAFEADYYKCVIDYKDAEEQK